MGKPGTQAPAADKADGAPDLKKLVTQASTDAQNAQRGSAGTVVAGPFPVGEIGQVQVIERQLGSSETKYLYAEFIGQGRPQRIPLAAVSVLAEKIA